MSRITIEVDPDLMELIPDFLGRKRADLRSLNEAIARDDFGTVASLGHKIKGEGGSFGFDAISEIGAELEVSAKRADREAVRRLVTDFSDYLQKIDVVAGPES